MKGWHILLLLVAFGAFPSISNGRKRHRKRQVIPVSIHEGSGDDNEPVHLKRDHHEDDPGENCHLPLGASSPTLVPRYSLQASDGHAHRGRLGQPTAWRTNKPLFPDARIQNNKDFAWIQVDLGEPDLVTGLQTQGDPIEEAWVTWYYVHYSVNCERFHPIIDTQGLIARFHGNFDSNSIVTNYFHDLVIARCLRIIPLRSHNNNTALRLEVLGCDVRLCKEGIVHHLEAELAVYNRSNILTANDMEVHGSYTHQSQRSRSENHTRQRSRSQSKIRNLTGGRGNPVLTPTHEYQGYAEFKFSAEQLLFGVVRVKVQGQRSHERFMVTYSRSCLHWEPIRMRKGFGDPKVFALGRSRYSRVWMSFPYPVRAQCVRILPITHHNVPRRTTIRAHFIGCGTGAGISHTCGLRKALPSLPPHHRSKRVIGGQAAHGPGLWPWLASLQLTDDGSTRHVCGATLIHPQWVMTAAHCMAVMYGLVYDDLNSTRDYSLWNEDRFLSYLKVRVGEFSLHVADGTQYDVPIDRVVGHPDYNMSHYINDIALLHLSSPVRLTDYVGLMCLPESEEQFLPGTECKVVGWGNTGHGFPYRAHVAPVPLVSHELCQDKYSHLNITPDMLCAGPDDGSTDACVGDSGGPLICESEPGSEQWYQVGIASWNIGCGQPGYPGVYGKVTAFTHWIHQVIGQNDQGNIGY